ncbi:MAG: hypothetical protein ACRED5_22780 [Propylenella sp.]
MIETAIEAVKLIGGIGGIASAIFLVYDRAFRWRPEVHLQPIDYSVHLVVRNVAPVSIIVDAICTSAAALHFRNTNDSLSKAEEVALRMYPRRLEGEALQRVFVVIDPMDKRTFQLVFGQEFEQLEAKKKIQIRCSWRNTRKPFPMQRSVSVQTTAEDIRGLREVALARGKGGG